MIIAAHAHTYRGLEINEGKHPSRSGVISRQTFTRVSTASEVILVSVDGRRGQDA